MKSPWHGVMLAALAASALTPALAGEKKQILFVERFDGALAKGWTWVREDPKAWRIDKWALVIRTSTGGLWQKHNNNSNILLRSLPDAKEGPVAVEVLVENEPTNAFEHAGLVWYCDDDNYAILVREKVGTKPIVQLVSEKQGTPKVGFAEKDFEPKIIWLRMEVSDGKARGLYRASEKEEWKLLGECELPVKGEPRIGLLTGYAPKGKEHESRFREFRIVKEAR
jgi:regulation of enolase protein 1 (concanavalin A-like superfamily)